MIDTIVLRIHNLKNYEQLKAQFFAPAQRKGSQTRAIVDHETAELIREVNLSPVVVFHDSNRVLNPVYRDHLRVPSSHYDLAYCINTEKDFMEFNFSIPKYKYATNVFQFINEHDTSASGQYNMLMMFLSDFLKRTLLQTPKMADVEINRIDLCYNQFFGSKEDALTYLEEQKKLLSRYARSSGNNRHSFDTSLVYVTRRYSFKIYHKGTEFRKHDMKQLMRSNPLKHDISFLEKTADRILRYELTVRSSYLNYLFRQHFFIAKKSADVSAFFNHNVNRYWRQLVNLGWSKLYENYFRTSKFFCMNSIYEDTNIVEFHECMKGHNDYKADKQGKAYDYRDTVKLDKVLFSVLYNEFWGHVKKYQLSHVIDLRSVTEKIKEINAEKKKRKKLGISTSNDQRSLDNTRMLMLAHIINNNGKIVDLKKYLPDSTYYRIQREMKQVGMTDNSTNIGIPNPKLDYTEYRMILGRFHKF